MTNLRKHWLLILTIVIGVLWWPVFMSLGLSPRGVRSNAELKNIDYWSIITNPSVTLIGPIGLLVIVVMTCIGFWRIKKRTPLMIVLFLATLGLYNILMVNYISSVNGFFDMTLNHVMSITYENKVYQLAIMNYSKPLDKVISFGVFECDVASVICSSIGGTGFIARPVPDARLMVDNNQLILDTGYKQIQMVPAVRKDDQGTGEILPLVGGS